MPEQAGVDLEALSDLCTPWCLRVVVTLRIAEYIVAGISDIHDLAAAAGCDADALHRVLGHLVGKGIFEQSQPGHFALNQAAEQLLDPGLRIGLDLTGIGGRFAGVWSTLPTYVRTGESAYHEVFGLPFWEDLDAHPEIAASFDELIGPTGHGAPDADLPISGGWDSVRTVVDIGGGTGAMLAELLRIHPTIRGTLVDLPKTVAQADVIFANTGVAERATTIGQSFFDPLPAGADLYILRGILNDWPDREAIVILRRCAEAARPHGRVVVLKGIEEDDAPPSLGIEMVLAGGKYRTLDKFKEIARQVGLEVAVSQRQSSGSFVVECRLS